MIEDIFKIPFYKTSLNLDNETLNEFCNDLVTKQKRIRNLSILGGVQSGEIGEEDSNNNPAVFSLATNITKHSALFAKEIGIVHELSIGSLWANIGGYKDSHRYHHHPHSMLGGVYYANAPKDCGSIRFYHPYWETMQYDWNKNTVNENTPYTIGTMDMPVTSNTLYIFPNWLNHSVEPNLNKKEKRISIAFNMFKSEGLY